LLSPRRPTSSSSGLCPKFSKPATFAQIPVSHPHATAPPPTNLPTVSEILDRYIAALSAPGPRTNHHPRRKRHRDLRRHLPSIEIFTAIPPKQPIVRNL